MGFYIEMVPALPSKRLFEETQIPNVFWVLYGIAFFAVGCMGAAAYTVLHDLFLKGELLDQVLLFSTMLFLPLLLLIGLKLALLKKFIDFSADSLSMGFKLPFHNWTILNKTFSRSEITDVSLVNKRQSANLAKFQHKDSRYHIRGHWKILIEARGKRFVLDRHTEKDCLEPLYNELRAWLGR